MAPKTRFSDGEKVLCFHGPLLYEAKCIKAQLKDKTLKYFIHYSGWNKNWDEWVPESRVLKYNEANLQKQKELEAAHGKGGKKNKNVKGGLKKETDRESSVLPPQEKTPKQKNKEAAASSTAPVAVETPAELQKKKGRSRAEQNVETEEEYIHKLEIRIKVTDELKPRICDDWNMITNQNKLLTLPARVTVENIISDFLKQKLSQKGITPNRETALVETTNGIREYFNVMLGKQLLYPSEKKQYAELVAANADLLPSQIYGAIHLLRLFTKLGGVLAYTQLDEDSITIITNNIIEFQRYIAKNAMSLFNPNDYIALPPEVKRAAAEVKKEV